MREESYNFMEAFDVVYSMKPDVEPLDGGNMEFHMMKDSKRLS